MEVYIYSPITCLNTITNCEYLKLKVDSNADFPAIIDVKPIIYDLQINNLKSVTNKATSWDTAVLINILNHIKGCKFGDYYHGENPNTYINIAYASNFLKNTDSISNFFKNNTFTCPITFVMAKTPDIKFINDSPDIGFVSLRCTPPSPKTWLTDFESPVISDFLAPLESESNANKFPCYNNRGKIQLDLVGNTKAKEQLKRELSSRYYIKFEIQ